MFEPDLVMTTQAKLTVCFVDDDADLRNAFKLILKSSSIPAMTFSSAEEFLANFDPAGVGCIVVDVRMPGMGGLELLAALRERHIFIPVVLLTGHADIQLVVQAMRGGAMDVLQKPFREEDMLSRVRQAFARYDKLKQFQAARQEIAPRIESLTARELEVLDLMVAGKKNKQIAEELEISPKTLDIHRANIMRKMQTKTVADLVRWRLMDKADPFTINPLA